MAFKLTSTAFAHNGNIPKRYTCEGDDISPPLSWTGVPESAKSLALIIDDPDAPNPAAPKRTWVHWVLYNIAPDTSGLIENCGAHGGLPDALDGTNDWGKAGYGGPCPPIGRHRYFHKLYALDTVLSDLHRPAKVSLLTALKGHILAETTLVGCYQKSRQAS